MLSDFFFFLLLIPQVEEDNQGALAFYTGMGFDRLFVDRAARRYDTSGFLLQNVRTSKLTMRKVTQGRCPAPRLSCRHSV